MGPSEQGPLYRVDVRSKSMEIPVGEVPQELALASTIFFSFFLMLLQLDS